MIPKPELMKWNQFLTWRKDVWVEARKVFVERRNRDVNLACGRR